MEPLHLDPDSDDTETMVYNNLVRAIHANDKQAVNRLLVRFQFYSQISNPIIMYSVMGYKKESIYHLYETMLNEDNTDRIHESGETDEDKLQQSYMKAYLVARVMSGDVSGAVKIFRDYVTFYPIHTATLNTMESLLIASKSPVVGKYYLLHPMLFSTITFFQKQGLFEEVEKIVNRVKSSTK